MEQKNKEIKIEEMFEAGVHFGYSRSHRHPKMKMFLFGLKNNIEIFDLEKVKEKLNEAKEFMKKLGMDKKMVIFVGTKPEIKGIIKKYAEEIEASYVVERWVGGTLTNFDSIKTRRDYMDEMTKKRESGELNKYTKKEQLKISRKIFRLKHYFSGLEQLKNLPSALMIIDTKKDKIAVREAKKMRIPIIGIANSDCNPEDAEYFIPANDNSISSVNFFLKELVNAYKDGLKEHKDEQKNEDAGDSKKTEDNK